MEQKTCKKCGTIIEQTARFCPKCGSQEFIEPFAPNNNETAQNKKCSRCGEMVELTAKFCPKCGSPEFVQATVQNAQQPYIPQQPFTTQQPVAPFSVAPSLQSQANNAHSTAQNQPSYTATLDVKKKGLRGWQIALIVVGALLALIILIGIFAGGDDNSNKPASNNPAATAPVASVSNQKKTIMIYMVGSDLESQNGAASLDIVEMAESGIDTSKHTVLIYTGGTKAWAISDIPTDKNSIYKLNGEDFDLVQTYSSLNMGASSTLAEFISFGMTNYAADSYGLILWDHGAGPMVGYGADELHNDILEMSELKTALSSAGLGNGKKLEFLGFDACLMGSIETAWEVKDFANYMIASQETEPGYGWNYKFLKYLNQYDSGNDIGKSIIDMYFSAHNEVVSQYPQAEADITLSCMDLSKIGKVESSLNTLFANVDKNILEGYFPSVSRARNNSKSFGKFTSNFNYDLIDIGHISSLLSSDYQSETKQLDSALKEFICYSKSNITNACGVSIYHPYDNEEYMNSWISHFKSLNFASQYAQYISDFGKLLTNPSSTSWRSFSGTKGIAEKKSSANELSIKLTDDQVKNFAGASYYVLKKIENDQYMFIFGGIDTELSSDGTLSATYNNKAVFAVNDKTKEVSDAPITMYQVRDGGTDLKYYASSIFWKFGDDMADWRTDPVEWQIKLDNGSPKALGAFLIEGNNGAEIPQKQMLDYKDYDTVEFSFSTRTLKRDSSGNILPYFEWESTGNFYGNQYNVSDGFHLESRKIENKNDYYVMFVVKDAQGNSFASELFTLPN